MQHCLCIPSCRLAHCSSLAACVPSAVLGTHLPPWHVVCPHTLAPARPAALPCWHAVLHTRSPCRPAAQFERERSRALSKELRAARERWSATEAERLASEDARRWAEARRSAALQPLAAQFWPCRSRIRMMLGVQAVHAVGR